LFPPEFVINPNGKSEVCILHEYMQRVLKVRPVYNFFECGKCAQKRDGRTEGGREGDVLALIRVEANK